MCITYLDLQKWQQCDPKYALFIINVNFNKMSIVRNVTAFSPNGEYLAYSSPDGCLKIWETSTNILKQEYTPSSHLSATCSALSWGPCKQTSHFSKKSKKLKKDHAHSTISDLQLIAMGTLTGDILLYSYANAELHSFLNHGHTSTVNDTCWFLDTGSLFTCSYDQHIIIWDICSGKIKTKWKADNSPIHSICVIDDNNLLSSSSTILWWNIKEKTVIKTFIGHATEVFRLIPIKTEESSRCYFISAAIGDRILNAWQLNENNSQRAIASFVLSDDPEDIAVITRPDEPLLMSVVSRDGILHMFEHTLNGKMKKPLQPKYNVQIASKANEPNSKPHPLPILAASILKGLHSCLLCYGSFVKPVFERIDISDVSNDLFLIRDSWVSTTASVEDSVSKIKQTEKPDNVKLLAPGHMMPLKPVHGSPKKRKLKEIDIKELPMEERLRALDLSKLPRNLEQESAIKSDSFVHLFLQGLQSKDKNMLNTVLQCSDETLIRNTLEKLPLQSILFVLKELHERLNKQEPRNHPCLKWMKVLLAVHLPYLMSCKDIDEYLGPISQLIEARIENYAKMCQLRGCLKILLSQAADCKSNVELSSEPLVTYQSESSEESDNDESSHSDNCSDEEIAHETLNEENYSSDSEDNMDL